MDTDAELLARLSKGDERALRGLYQRYSAKVYALALRFLHTREEAEEVLQDTFLKLYRRGSSYRRSQNEHGDPASVSAFLYAIARNECRMRLRARRSRPNQATWDMYGLGTEFLAAEPKDFVSRVMIERALEKLDKDDRDLLRKAFFWGYSHSELAELTGMPLGTVKTRLRRALIELRDYLEDHESP